MEARHRSNSASYAADARSKSPFAAATPARAFSALTTSNSSPAASKRSMLERAAASASSSRPNDAMLQLTNMS